MRELFADTLLSTRSLSRGYFQAPFVRRLVDEHVSGRRDHTLRLWQLVVFERWHAQYLDQTGSALPFDAPSVPLDTTARTA
jgi:asparagine synthase (glutamine-hydrolysing)